MPKIVVVNSTPIIALKNIGLLPILEDVYGEISIPSAVNEEIAIYDENWVALYPWIHVRRVLNSEVVSFLSSSLHKGEIEALLLARELSADLIIVDDNLARKHAGYLGLVVTGTIGVLLRAKQEGVVSMLAPIIRDLISSGFYISESIINEVLILAGESIDK